MHVGRLGKGDVPGDGAQGDGRAGGREKQDRRETVRSTVNPSSCGSTTMVQRVSRTLHPGNLCFQ